MEKRKCLWITRRFLKCSRYDCRELEFDFNNVATMCQVTSTTLPLSFIFAVNQAISRKVQCQVSRPGYKQDEAQVKIQNL